MYTLLLSTMDFATDTFQSPQIHQISSLFFLCRHLNGTEYLQIKKYTQKNSPISPVTVNREQVESG